ncbi:MAG: serine hydrolase [Anaerolineales bacterium]|nr:serine hydrolase [Anaerolineales bacterium]
MLRSDFMALDDVCDGVAEGYLPIKDASETIIDWKKNIYSATPAAAADGGGTSTAMDLVWFSRALREGLLLSPGMTQAMLSPHVLAEEKPIRGYTWKYGFANMFILDEGGQIVRWGHTGEEDGVSCRLYYYPERDLDVIILANQSWCAGSLGWQMHDLILEMNP